MKFRHKFVQAALVAILLLTGTTARAASHATTLTGINVFTTVTPLFNYQNTVGGDTFSYNIYELAGLPAASLNTSNPFLSSGNLATAPTRISIDLSAPGSYSYTFLGDTNAGTLGPAVGINFFFNGDDLHPGISASETANTTSTSFFPAFSADSATTTTTLNPNVNGGVAGAGTLSFIDGTTRVTLSEYRYSEPAVFNVDRVSGFDVGANGAKDAVTEFTLTVSTVPEPASVSIFAAAGLLLRRRPTRHRLAE